MTNFMSYVGVHSVRLDRLGLALLSGRNLDDPANNSNGSGKSTVLEAVTWALFGEGLPRRQGNSERGVSADEVCSDRVGQQTRVEVVLEDEATGQSIGVARWRKYKGVSLEEAAFGQGQTGVKVTKPASRARTNGVLLRVGEQVEQYLDMDEGTRRIREVLGISRDIWCKSVVFGQESQFNFCESTSKERADILTTVMGLEQVDRWLGRARDERADRQRELARVEGELEATIKVRAQVQADDPAAKVARWKAEQAERVTSARQRLAAAEVEGRRRKGVFSAMEDPAPARQAAQIEYQDAQAALGAAPSSAPVDGSAVQAAQAALRAAQAPDQTAARVALAEMDAAGQVDQGPVLVAQKERDAAVVEVGVLQEAVGKLRALSGAVCPTCLRPIDRAQSEALFRDLSAQLQAAQTRAEQGQARFDAVRAAAFAAAEARKAEARGRYEAILGAQREELARAQAAYDQAYAAWKASTDAAETRAAQERAGALRRVQAAHAAREAADAAMRGYEKAARELEEARQDWVRAAEAVKAILEEVNPYQVLVDQRAHQLADLDQAIDSIEEERAEEQERIGLLNWWDAEIPRFKTWLFDSVVDALAVEANRWLRVMSAGVIWVQVTTSKQLKTGEMRDELDVQVFRWNPDGSITSRPYRIWSGGEKRRVALAVDLGLSRLMATRASKAYRFLALDEIDRHLDDQGREGLRQVLEELRGERETCLVVTHDPNFRASFDVELAVTKQAGTSRLEVRRADQNQGGAAAQAAAKEGQEGPGQAGDGAAGDAAAGRGAEAEAVVPAGGDVRPTGKGRARGKRRARSAPGDAGAAGGSAPLPGAD